MNTTPVDPMRKMLDWRSRCSQKNERLAHRGPCGVARITMNKAGWMHDPPAAEAVGSSRVMRRNLQSRTATALGATYYMLRRDLSLRPQTIGFRGSSHLPCGIPKQLPLARGGIVYFGANPAERRYAQRSGILAFPEALAQPAHRFASDYGDETRLPSRRPGQLRVFYH
jgi:hypothetical protein